jgi:hypothetical protein
VTQGVDMSAFGNTSSFPGVVEGALQAVAIDRTFCRRAPDGCRKEPFRRAVRFPEIAQHRQRSLRHPFVQRPKATSAIIGDLILNNPNAVRP